MSETGATTKENKGVLAGRVGGFIRRHRKLFIFLVILAVVVGLVLWVMASLGSAAANFIQPPQTLTLQRTDLQQIVSGTGTLQSSATREVTSSLAYEILEVYVEEGSQVEAGQLLAMLDTTEIDKSIETARKSIADAQASDALSLAQAERKLQDAINQKSIDEANQNKAVEKAQNALNSAGASVSNAQNTVNVALNNVTIAQTGWNDAKTSATPPLTDNDGPTLQTGDYGYDEWQALQSATKAYTDAQATYNTTAATLTTAQNSYDTAVQQRDTTLRQDSISIENAHDNINTLKLKDSAATYRTQLEGYLEDKADCLITAPVAGTITAMTAEVGSGAGGGAAMGSAATASSALFTIEDVDRLQITSSIPEYDAIIVQPGMQVSITSDAVSGESWTGMVKSVSTKAADTSGNFTVVIDVTSPVGQLAIGMGTKFNVITDAKNDVFAVPYDAVTTDENGDDVVYVYSAGAPAQAPSAEGTPEGAQPAIMGTPIVVRTGMETDYYIEISGDGLEEGLSILSDPEGKNVSTGTGMGGFMMGGGF